MIGPYIRDEHERAEMAQWLLDFTNGFLAAPLPIPGTMLYKAIQAKKRLLKRAETIVNASRERMNGSEASPQCMLDLMLSCENADNLSDSRIAILLLDCLFAAQDATTSATAWALEILHDEPQIRDRIIAEVEQHQHQQQQQQQHGIKSRHGDGVFDDEYAVDKASLSFTKNVVIEMLRVRPPVPMVPHLCEQTMQLGPVTIPKGSLLIPSKYHADNNNEDNDADTLNVDNVADGNFRQVLVFGAGPHMCPGRFYAIQVVTIFSAMLCAKTHFHRSISQSHDKTDSYMFLPTLFPSNSVYRFEKR